MGNPMRGLLLAVLLIVLPADASTHRPMSFDALVQNSDLIIYGRVLESRPARDPAVGMIWTRTDVLVLDCPKGQAASVVSISEPGGIADGKGEFYPGTPQFRAGQELVLFLNWAPGNRLRVTGAMQGVYHVARDGRTGELIALPVVKPQETIFEEGSPYAASVKQQASGPPKLSRFLYTIRQRVTNR